MICIVRSLKLAARQQLDSQDAKVIANDKTRLLREDTRLSFGRSVMLNREGLVLHITAKRQDRNGRNVGHSGTRQGCKQSIKEGEAALRLRVFLAQTDFRRDGVLDIHARMDTEKAVQAS